MGKKNIYEKNGYMDRQEYLESVAIDYNVPMDVVLSIADALGSNEDFDGLICAMDDAGDYSW